MNYTVRAKKATGGEITLSVPIIGRDIETGTPILGLRMMSDDQWNELANKKSPCDLAGYTRDKINTATKL